MTTRDTFITRVISAIATKATPENADLASRAFNSLHYDFPVVTATEINALATAFRDSVGFKDGWFPYRLTARLVDNAVSGATRIQAQQRRDLSSGQQTQQDGREVSLEENLEAEATSTANGEASESGDGDLLQAAYSQLCSAILMSFMRKVLSLPEPDAWDLLEHYLPASADPKGIPRVSEPMDVDQYRLPGGDSCTQEHQDQQRDKGGESSPYGTLEEAEDQDGDDCVYEDMALGAALPVSSGAVPLGPLSLPSSASPQPCLSTIEEPRYGSGIGWQDLRSRILSLGSQVTYSAVSHASIWSPSGEPSGSSSGEGGMGGGGLDAILGVLRVLGIHSHARDLMPLLHIYVNLLADRLCDMPQGLSSCLGQLWYVLGVEQLAASSSSSGAPRNSSTSKKGSCGGSGSGPVVGSATTPASSVTKGLILTVIPAEATAAFSIVAQLAAHYCGSGAALRSYSGSTSSSGLASGSTAAVDGMLPRQELWRQVHGGRLLELAAVCLVDLSAAPKQGPEQLAAALLIAQASQREDCLRAAQVLLFYLRHRPGGLDVAKHLLKMGVVRGLAVLLPKCCLLSSTGPSPGAATGSNDPPAGTILGSPLPVSSTESLRLVALMCAACSPAEVGTWMLAVPGFKAWLESDREMRPGGAAETHGAIWQLLTAEISALSEAQRKGKALLPTNQEFEKSGCTTRGDATMCAVAGASASMLGQLLQSSDLARLHATVQLMTSVQRVADGRVSWGMEIKARIHLLIQELRGKAVQKTVALQQNAASMQLSDTELLCDALKDGNAMERPYELTGAADPEQQRRQQMTAGNDNLEEEERDEIDSEDHEDDDFKLHNHDPDILKARREMRLVPECIRMLKSLVVSGGKTD